LSVPLQAKYDQINDHALLILPDLLREWFPLGRMDSKTEFVVGNLDGDQGGSLSINIKTGKWKEFAGGPGGHDPLGLYAHTFCGGDRKQAFKELRAKFGFSDDAPLPRRKPNLKVVKSEPADDWKSMVPPPDGVGKPKIKGNVPVYTYLGPNEVVLRYVSRHEREDKTKFFIPHTYGTDKDGTGWREKHPNTPMCLYGLDRLGGKPVLLQEGEQKSDDVQKALTGWACLGWSGGGNRAKDHDYSLLTADTVYVVGDAVDGVKGMMDAADCLYRLGAKVFTVDTSMFPKGWDLGNAATGEMWKKGELVWKSETGPWTVDQIESFIHEHAKIYDPDPGNVDAEPDLGEPNYEDDSDWLKDPEEHATPTEGVIPLGHDNNIFYYLSRSGGQVVGLTPSKHTELELIALADPVTYWEKLLMFKKRDGGCNYKKAAAWMIKWAKWRGIFKPDLLRGRGAWLDVDVRDGTVRAVLHLGESLIVDGVFQRSLRLEGSKFIYVKATQLGQIVADPVRTPDAHKLMKMCQLLRWENQTSATLAAGFIVVAAICGALSWRPSVWITGGSSSGKTTFLKDIIAPILGRGMDDGIALNVQSKTTEAGLRQMLGSDARPVFFDEAEAEMLQDKTRMQSVIDLNRQSSSEGGAEIVKGTQNQSGAKRYRIRSSFMYSSINIFLDHKADESRITVLDLYNPGPHELERDRKRWAELCALMAETVADPIWCAGMVARSVWLMKTIRKNAETFKLAVIEEMGNSRAGDQIGTLLAGAYSLTSDREITLDEARAYLKRKDDKGKLVNDFRSATAIDAQKDEERLLDRLVQQPLHLASAKADRTVGELIAMAEERDDEAAKLLRRNGFLFVPKIIREGTEAGLWISNTHTAIRKWLADTPWSTGWGRSLKRIPGAKSSDPKVIVFTKLIKTKAVWVPLVTLDGSDEG
jgi:putative DNA primase/helicase